MPTVHSSQPELTALAVWIEPRNSNIQVYQKPYLMHLPNHRPTQLPCFDGPKADRGAEYIVTNSRHAGIMERRPTFDLVAAGRYGIKNMASTFNISQLGTVVPHGFDSQVGFCSFFFKFRQRPLDQKCFSKYYISFESSMKPPTRKI